MKQKNPMPNQREKFLEDLEVTFQAALAGKNFPAAVKAKELQAKELGFFNMENRNKVSLKDLGIEGLQRLLKDVESHPFKHIQDLQDIKKEISDLKEALEERDNLKKKSKDL